MTGPARPPGAGADQPDGGSPDPPESDPTDPPTGGVRRAGRALARGAAIALMFAMEVVSTAAHRLGRLADSSALAGVRLSAVFHRTSLWLDRHADRLDAYVDDGLSGRADSPSPDRTPDEGNQEPEIADAEAADVSPPAVPASPRQLAVCWSFAVSAALDDDQLATALRTATTTTATRPFGTSLVPIARAQLLAWAVAVRQDHPDVPLDEALTADLDADRPTPRASLDTVPVPPPHPPHDGLPGLYERITHLIVQRPDLTSGTPEPVRQHDAGHGIEPDL